MDEIQALEYLRQTPLSELDGAARAMRASRHTLIKVKYGTTKYPRLPLLKKIMAWAERNGTRKAA